MNKPLLQLLAFTTIISGAMLFTSTKASATVTVCNKSNDKAFVAVAYNVNKMWQSDGWTHVEANQCKDFLNSDDLTRSGYLYIADNDWRQWSIEDKTAPVLNKNFCLKQEPFAIDKADMNCGSTMLRKTFQKRDVAGDYTIRLF